MNYQEYKKRRQELVKRVGKPVLLGSAYERDIFPFHQDNNFYYYTGIEEPGCFCLIDENGESKLFVPVYPASRATWVERVSLLDNSSKDNYEFEAIEPLGEAFSCLISCLQENYFSTNRMLGIVSSEGMRELSKVLPVLVESITDISLEIARMRRIKSRSEIEKIYDAVQLAMVAHDAAAQAIAEGKFECEVQAAAEFILTGKGARPAFPTIVGGGANSTILHYHSNKSLLQSGSCVVVDLGARYHHYCSDLTRTYPVTGNFSEKQRDLYSHVRDAQAYVAEHAKPGYWLKNDEHPEKSLHHLAVDFFKKRGLEEYFVHNVGHFLGLDVHDVGNVKEPLQPGDVITIEPGLYLPEEEIGIRLEDNYWIIEDGAVCLSEQLPSQANEIEKMVQDSLYEA